MGRTPTEELIYRQSKQVNELSHLTGIIQAANLADLMNMGFPFDIEKLIDREQKLIRIKRMDRSKQCKS